MEVYVIEVYEQQELQDTSCPSRILRGGVFIDAYNQSINEDIAGTITTRVDASNMVFVTVYEQNQDSPSDQEGLHRGPDGGGI